VGPVVEVGRYELTAAQEYKNSVKHREVQQNLIDPSGCEWATVPRTRDLNILRRRVPLAEIYCSISENFHIVYTNKTGESSVGMTPMWWVEVGGVATLSAPRSLEGLLGFERNGRGTVTPGARFGDHIHAPTQRSGS